MKVVLKEDIDNVGKRGEKVDVADGYARNYLLPKGLALLATIHNLKLLDIEKRKIVAHEIKEKAEAEVLAGKLAQKSLTVVRKVGESDILYGSVTAADICELLQKEGIEIDRRKIELEEPIKTTGIFTIPIRIYKDVSAEIKLWIVKE